MKGMIQRVALLLLIVIVVQSQTTYPETNQPRQDHSCQTYGWYWDGQKCEQCLTEYCKCSSYNGCTGCAPGFSLIQTDKAKTGTCIACPQINDNTYFTPNSKQTQIDYQSFNFLTTLDGRSTADQPPQPLVQECCNPFETLQIWDTANLNYYTKGLRATKCKDNIDKTAVFQLDGYGICWYMKGCQEYTTYGKCKTCMDGYFLDAFQTCTACINQCPDATCTLTACLKCFSAVQCDVCQNGYYLEKIENYVSPATPTTQTLTFSSWCKPCNTGCQCSSTDKITNAIDGYYLQGSTCNPCTNINPQCLTCQATSKTTECLTCATGYIKNTVDPTKCIQCPTGCYQCQQDSKSGSATCVVNMCMNGYYEVVDNNGIRTCSPCSSTPNFLRCNSNMQGTTLNILPTQCGDRNLYEWRNIDNTVGTQNLYLSNKIIGLQTTAISYINNNKQFLVNNQCLSSNNLKCRMLATTSTPTSVTCQNCYDGFILTSDNVCRNCNSGLNGVSIEHQEDAGTPCLSCIQDPVNSAKLVCTLCPTNNNEPNTYNVGSITNYFTAKTGSKRCTKCLDFCQNCDDDPQYCKVCRTGYLLSTDKKKCNLCQPENCADCSDTKGGSGTPVINYCKTCFPKYRLWQNPTNANYKLQSCEKCEDNYCLNCDTSRKVCTLCSSGYYLSGQVCHPQKPFCAKMKAQSDQCEVCNYGYRLIDGRCLRCFGQNGGFVHCHKDCTNNNNNWAGNIDLDAWAAYNAPQPTPTPNPTPVTPSSNSQPSGAMRITLYIASIILLIISIFA